MRRSSTPSRPHRLLPRGQRARGPALGLALDGTGFGTDGAIWGCEVLACDHASFERLLHLRYVPLPVEPRPSGNLGVWRRSTSKRRSVTERKQCNWISSEPRLHAGGRSHRWRPRASIHPSPLVQVGCSMQLPPSVGSATVSPMRARPPAELEQIADPSVRDGYDCTFDAGIIDGVELVAGVAQDLERGRPVPLVAARFHNGLAAALVAAAERARRHGSEHGCPFGGHLPERPVAGARHRCAHDGWFRGIDPSKGALQRRRDLPGSGDRGERTRELTENRLG